MSTKAKHRNSSRNDQVVARFIVDIFVFSTLINGVACSSTRLQFGPVGVPAKDQRHAMGKQSHGIPYSSFAAGNVRQQQTGKALATNFFDHVLNWIFDKEVGKGDQNREDKTLRFGHRFVGHRKRLQFALLPIMYKMGVMTTLLTGLTVLALKGLTIGVILLFFALGNHFLKYAKWKSPSSSQPIHVHVHSPDGSDKLVKYNYESEGVYGPWDRSEVEEEYPQPFEEDGGWGSYRKKMDSNRFKLGQRQRHST